MIGGYVSYAEPIQCDRQAESIYLASRILHHCASAWGRPHSAVGQKNHCTYTSWTTLAGKKKKNIHKEDETDS